MSIRHYFTHTINLLALKLIQYSWKPNIKESFKYKLMSFIYKKWIVAHNICCVNLYLFICWLGPFFDHRQAIKVTIILSSIKWPPMALAHQSRSFSSCLKVSLNGWAFPLPAMILHCINGVLYVRSTQMMPFRL